MGNHKIKRGKLISLITVAALMFSSCGIYDKHESGYTEVNTVKGVLFEVPSEYSGSATAINTISESENYDGMYVYKDGESNYFMFQMNSLAIICEKNTSYNFRDAEDKEAALSNSQISSKAWLTAVDDTSLEDDTSNGVYKIYGRVDAQITLTANQYGDFRGYMASINDGETEYTLFAGATGTEELTKEQEEIVKHVTRAFCIDKDYKEMVSVDTDTEKIADEVDEANATEDADNTEVEETIEPVEEIEEPAEDVVVIEDEEAEKPSDPEPTEETEETTEEAEEPGENTEADNDDEVVVEEEIAEVEEEMPVQTVTNADVLKNPSKSDYYNPLKITQTGQYSPGMYIEGEYSDYAAVHIDNLYTGSEAEELLKSLGVTRKAKDGTSYQVIEYTTSCDITKFYTNIKITGLDGERLKYRGISYTTRTYDVLSKAISGNNRYEKLYCYYEVPNGCKEYALEFGEYNDGLGAIAFYQINN